MAEEIAWLSAVELLARFRARTLSPVEVADVLLGRIDNNTVLDLLAVAEAMPAVNLFGDALRGFLDPKLT